MVVWRREGRVEGGKVFMDGWMDWRIDEWMDG